MRKIPHCRKELFQKLIRGNLVQKFLPNQADVDKIKGDTKKEFKGTHLPIKIKEIQAGYLNSPYFKDIYLYLAQNRLPNAKEVIRKVEILSERNPLTQDDVFRFNII